MKLRLGATLILLFLSGCSVDIGNGSQLAGQTCFQESDCADGLTCFERVCRPQLNGAPRPDRDSGNPDGGNNVTPIDMGRPDMPFLDTGQGECVVGPPVCVGERTYEICVDIDGVGERRRVDCLGGEVCANGRCVPEGMCNDVDGDGYGVGCALGGDCDDSNPRINPGRRENCVTPFDDNCNGEANEGCMNNQCCPNGCPEDQFCSADCACVPFDEDVCEYQNQPCDEEGDFVNGFFCASIDGQSQPRCYGICDVNAANPDSTCPEAGTVCAFDGGDGQSGICLSTCYRDDNGNDVGCGEPNMGCLNLDVADGVDGVCTPTNDSNQRGDTCDPDNFFDCAEGLICADFGGFNGARCREACRPFAFQGRNTDCAQGYCLAFSAGFGVCSPDNGSNEGQSCSPQFSSCGDDAVSCYPDPQGQGNICYRLCRIDEGSTDCRGNDQCVQFDMNQEELGVCF